MAQRRELDPSAPAGDRHVPLRDRLGQQDDDRVGRRFLDGLEQRSRCLIGCVVEPVDDQDAAGTIGRLAEGRGDDGVAGLANEQRRASGFMPLDVGMLVLEREPHLAIASCVVGTFGATKVERLHRCSKGACRLGLAGARWPDEVIRVQRVGRPRLQRSARLGLADDRRPRGVEVDHVCHPNRSCNAASTAAVTAASGWVASMTTQRSASAAAWAKNDCRTRS